MKLNFCFDVLLVVIHVIPLYIPEKICFSLNALTNIIYFTGRGLNRPATYQFTTSIHEIYHAKMFHLENPGYPAKEWIEKYWEHPIRRYGEEIAAWQFVREKWVNYFGTIPQEINDYLSMRIERNIEEYRIAVKKTDPKGNIIRDMCKL